MSTLSKALFCCAVAASTSAVHAQSSNASISASISNFEFELIDLNPADSITPSISFGNAHRYVVVRYFDAAGSLSQVLESEGNVEITPPFGSAQASLSSTGASASVDYAVPTLRDMQYYAEAHYDTEFTLSPYTAVRFSSIGAVSSSLATDGQYNTSNISMTGGFQSWNEPLLYENQYFTNIYTMYGTERNYIMQGLLSTHDQSRTGTFNLSANAIGWLSVAPPVPEPASYAMMAAGLLVMGAVARRSRRRP